MIKAVTVNALGVPNMVILGLSAENCFRLVEGQPIPVRLRELHRGLPDVTVLLVGGQTEEAIAAELRKRMPTTRMPPPAAPAGADVEDELLCLARARALVAEHPDGEVPVVEVAVLRRALGMGEG